MIVANTDGEGAYMRRSPRLDDRLTPWTDGTVLQATGRGAENEGLQWLEVCDPSGNLGWVPVRYTGAPPAPRNPRILVVANTDSEGVYLRRTPRMADRLIAWSDGTELEATGQTAEGDGHPWAEVRNPTRNLGWVPVQYTQSR